VSKANTKYGGGGTRDTGKEWIQLTVGVGGSREGKKRLHNVGGQPASQCVFHARKRFGGKKWSGRKWDPRKKPE